MKRYKEETNFSAQDFRACILVIVAATLLAVAPHVATYAKYGTLEFLADADDIAYLAVARAPYYGESALRDPFSGRWERVPSLYSWAQFAPLSKLTAALGLPLILEGLIWRIIGGALMGATLYLLFRRLFADTSRPVAFACAASLICLADAGFVQGRTLVESWSLISNMLRGTTPLQKPDALAQYRVVTPLTNLPFLFLLVASLVPAARRDAKNALLGCAALGMCFLLYFYFWTATVGGICFYVAWLLFDAWREPKERTENLRRAAFAVIVLIGGVALGAWQVIGNSQTFADPSYKPILYRLSKGFPLAPGDPLRRMYVVNLWLWAKLAVGAFAIIFLRVRGLRLLWCTAFAGYLLANSAIVTGLEFENFHWSYVYSTMSEIMLLGVGVKLLDRWCGGESAPPERRKYLRLAWAASLLLFALALVWRPYEALRAPESAKNSRIIGELQSIKPELNKLSPDCSLAGETDAANVALLYAQSAQLYQEPYTAHLSFIADREVHERHALNAWLEGLSEADYLKTATAQRFSGGAFTKPEWEPNVVRQARAQIFERLESDGAGELVARYRPCYLLLPASQPQPSRGGAWSLVAKNRDWALWKRAAERES